ncbi:maleylpyruvate isomerase N-terminal domain-containing protein [Corynebacterium lubricantis]|uniref:maleylpyruvate isomerase N-terminal domain-containing protein n=1 Tax=Corynebacterium lubricantis TaxID=541095 RepID=UPI000368746F|nr:maleylpyruvate isomerase N-terminal domain-containing protein [Corynebacterium lubricantis]
MDTRQWFSQATTGLISLLPGLTDQLDAPGLGVWSIRSLLGHTSRAFTTIETYLDTEPVNPGTIDLDSPAAYYRAASATLADPAQVAERGHQAGLALGDDAEATVRASATSVLDLVAASADDAVVVTPLGKMTLSGYLPTRAFEVTVHSLDLANASHQPIPAETLACITPALELATRIASPDQQLHLLLAATGRTTLTPGFSVL